MEGYKDYKKLNNQFFSKLLTDNSDEAKVIGNSPASHQKRFKKLLELGNFDGKSVLDIGCGTGAFYRFLSAHSSRFDYTGYEVNEKMLEKARKSHPEIADRFLLLDILEEPVDKSFDYCLSIGSLNLFMDEKTNYGMTFHMLDEMFAHCKIGFAFSMTSSLSRKKQADTFYYDPIIITNHVMRYCNNFRLDHSFLPHDFMLFCYKDDFYK
jgi:SAM-dependent methyltransferase